ncbi:hypothetical protein C0J52_19543 [Blattella germanica]|nr:hypothetical protein C0J52_19543 [Blattella germanica]
MRRQYKSVLKDNRRRLIYPNLKEMFVTHCYYNTLSVKYIITCFIDLSSVMCCQYEKCLNDRVANLNNGDKKAPKNLQ